MKFVITLAAVLLASWSVVRAERPAVHGMVVFGETRILMSHLPLFHPPHDWQVIFEVSLKHNTTNISDVYHPSQDAPGDQLYTFEPIPFKLTEMIEHPTAMTGSLYKGHFEKDGQLLLTDVEAAIAQVVFHKKLAPIPAPALQNSYLMIGTETKGAEEVFVIHRIDGKPSFDEIAQVSISSTGNAAGTGECRLNGAAFKIPGGESPLDVGFRGSYVYFLSEDLALSDMAFECNYEVSSVIYNSDEDLQN